MVVYRQVAAIVNLGQAIVVQFQGTVAMDLFGAVVLSERFQVF